MAGRLERNDFLEHLGRLLRPVARFALRQGGTVQDLVECLKVALLDAAREEIAKQGEAATGSRVAVLTGLHRRDVTRLAKRETKFSATGGVATKVVGQWLGHRSYLDQSARPRPLSCGSDESEFNALCRSVSTDVNPASVLFALERAGTVRREGDTVSLVRESFIPSKDASAGYAILADDAEDLFEAVQENLDERSAVPNLHRRTMYDNVDPDRIPELRRWLIEEGLALHKRARERIGACDQDLNPPKSPKRGVKVVLGTFSKIYEER